MAENKFLEALHKAENRTLTENGSVAYKSTLSEFADQFGLAGSYRGRSLDAVFSDMERLWKVDPTMALRFIFYLRAITRKVKIDSERTTDSAVKGQGVRDEVFKRLLWVAKYHEDSFYKNIVFLPIVGSWKDVWQLLFYDVNLGVNAIDHDAMFELISTFISDDIKVDLIKKFLPRIKASSKCKTPWTKITNKLAKEFATYCGMTYAEYNHFKVSGTAHDFQKLMCSGNYAAIDWNKVPGKALNLITKGKFIEKHGLVEKFTEWVLSKDKTKFTGYVYELFNAVKPYLRRDGNFPLHKKLVFDKQFDTLIENAEKDGKITGNVWCALDTSGSMGSHINGSNITAYDVCVSLGIFFSSLNKGAFHKNVIMFDDVSRVKQLEGSFTDMASQIAFSSIAWGGTDFLSVVREIVRIRKNNPQIPLEDYPNTLIVVSDMQFNTFDGDVDGNYAEMKRMLCEVFPQEFVDGMKFIWWNCISRVPNFPATIEDGGCYFLSGFDGSIIQLLLGGEVVDKETGEKKRLSMEELIESALNQEVFSLVEA